MCENMEEKFIHSKCKIPIKQRFYYSWCLIPHPPNFRESFCLYNVLSIDMCATDGIKHIIGLVVRGGVQPIFAHGNVNVFIMLYAVRNHGGSNTLGTELNAVFLCPFFDSSKEYVVNQIIDGKSDVTQYLFIIPHRNTRINRQIG